MFTVALVGVDGAGKSTVSKMVVSRMVDLPLKHVYMGINLESSNLMLPTTHLLLTLKRARGGRPDMAGPYIKAKAKPAPKSPGKRLLIELKAWLLLFNRMAEEWFRLAVVWIYLKRGYNVLFDRHFVWDYYFYDMLYKDKNKPLTRRIHGYLLNKFYPRPELVIYLDAPAELLFQRKGEGTIESLERRRKEYLGLGKVIPHFEIVDASQPLEEVVEQVCTIVRDYAKNKSYSHHAWSLWKNQVP